LGGGRRQITRREGNEIVSTVKGGSSTSVRRSLAPEAALAQGLEKQQAELAKLLAEVVQNTERTAEHTKVFA